MAENLSLRSAAACEMAFAVMPTTYKSPSARDNEVANQEVLVMSNPVFHFEIPVTDMDRAAAFYQDVLGLELRRQTVDGYEMAFFPRDDLQPGASGALAKGDVYQAVEKGLALRAAS